MKKLSPPDSTEVALLENGGLKEARLTAFKYLKDCHRQQKNALLIFVLEGKPKHHSHRQISTWWKEKIFITNGALQQLNI